MKYVLLRFPDFRSKAVTFSYDDGVIYDRRLMEIMDKNGLKGTFNLNSGRFSEDGKFQLTKQQAIDLYTNSGHEVAIHGRRHLSLTEVPTAMATEDVLNDRIALEEMFGKVITGLAYANGAFDDKVVEILKNCGVEYARTAISTENFDLPNDLLRWPATCHHNNPRLMELARSFVEGEPRRYFWQRPPKLFYLWGHSYEFNNDKNWNVIEDFAAYIGNREDIWYATNMEICRYLKAFNSLQFGANGSVVYNPSAIDVYLNDLSGEVVVPAGETVKLN